MLISGRRRRSWHRAVEPARFRSGSASDARVSSPCRWGSIKPAGWLESTAPAPRPTGLSGHLDEFWPDIKDSAWIGGKAEGWERVPYWLDGLVPLAYLLDDPSLQAKVKRFDRLHPGAPAARRLARADRRHGRTQALRRLAALPPASRPSTQYQEATGDPRVIPALLKCCRKIDQVIDREPLYSWAQVPRRRLRRHASTGSMTRTGEPWLLDLARKAFAQSHDWRAQFDDFKFTGKTQGKFELDTHGVNTGMALKYGGVRYLLTGDAKDKDAVFRDARPARPLPRPGHRHLHLRRAPGRPQPVAGDRALHGGRGDVLARGPLGRRWATPGWATGWRSSPSTPCRRPSRRT